MSYAENLPQDMRLWFLCADRETGALERDVPLSVAHDAFKRKLVRDDAGTWVLTVDGRAVLNNFLSD